MKHIYFLTLPIVTVLCSFLFIRSIVMGLKDIGVKLIKPTVKRVNSSGCDAPFISRIKM